MNMIAKEIEFEPEYNHESAASMRVTTALSGALFELEISIKRTESLQARVIGGARRF